MEYRINKNLFIILEQDLSSIRIIYKGRTFHNELFPNTNTKLFRDNYLYYVTPTFVCILFDIYRKHEAMSFVNVKIPDCEYYYICEESQISAILDMIEEKVIQKYNGRFSIVRDKFVTKTKFDSLYLIAEYI